MTFFRIGLVFVVNKEENVDGNKDVGVALLRAFNYIMKQDSATKALSFLTDVSVSVERVVYNMQNCAVMGFMYKCRKLICIYIRKVLASDVTR
jgi:hypothetical protein